VIEPAGPAGLQVLGLSAAEEAAYELLIDRPDATGPELELAWHRRERLDTVLAGLGAHGLLRLVPGSPARYVAAPPQIALEALALEQERHLRAARHHAERLAETYRARTSADSSGLPVEVVTGLRAVEQRTAQIQSSAQSSIRRLDRSPDPLQVDVRFADPGPAGPRVVRRTLFSRAAVEEPDAVTRLEDLTQAGLDARVLPDVPMSLCLVDDQYAVLPLRTAHAGARAAVVVYPCGLLDALADLFEGLWQRAIPLDFPASRALHARGRTRTDDQRLVALMLSGLTDQAIARQLGLGHRTVQRRIAALIGELGVRTRFQAGVQAAFRAIAPPDRSEAGPG
jgi:hypothetical protein